MRIRLLLASALAGTLLMGSLPSSVRAGESTVRATGRMTVSASGTAYTQLYVPRPARLSLNYYVDKDLPTPRFSHGPEFGAVVLISETERGKTYGAYRLPDSKGVSRRMLSLGPDFCQVNDDYCKLAAGDYRLYLVTEVPLRVRLELEGLAGTSTVKLEKHAIGEISGATESYFHSTPQGEVEVAAHGAGFSPNLTGESNYMFSAFWFRGPQDLFGPPPADQPLLQIGDVGSCFYFGSPPADAYAPGCPGGNMNHNFVNLFALRHFGYTHWGSAAPLPPGEYGRGDYAVHTGIRHPGFVGFWLDLAS